MIKKMPVKVDLNCYGLSAHPCFDCDVLTELKEMSDDLSTDKCLSPCEDIWKKFDDFLLTPPQSPPIKLDLVSDLVDFTSVESIAANDNTVNLHNADVLHDCMWSGQCAEDTTTHCSADKTGANAMRCARNHSRPDTPFTALSTSPFAMTSAFNEYLLSSCETSSNEDIEDSQSSVDDLSLMSSPSSSSLSSSSSTSFAKVKESLINDHSYGGSVIISQHKNNNKYNNYETQSLIYPKHKVQSRKCHKINANKIKIIKANSPMSSPSKPLNEKEVERIVAVPTVRIIRNDKHCLKSKSFIPSIGSKDGSHIRQQKQCKFSTRRKASTVSSERSVMFAQNVHQFVHQSNQSNHSPNDRFSDDESSLGSPDKSSKTVPPLRRREHNDSERKRRDHLRNAFINLKDQIPKLKSAEKRPPRIMILHEATAYVCHLNDKQIYLERTLNAEIEKRERLLKILSNEYKTESK